MSTHTTRRTNRTVAGSYEAPVQGISDYSSFGRAFDDAFKMPVIKEEKEEKPKPLGKDFDSTIDPLTAQEGARVEGVSFSAEALINLNESMRSGFGLEELAFKAGIADQKGDVQKYAEYERELAKIKSTRNGAQALFETSAEFYTLSNQRGATPMAKIDGVAIYAPELAEAVDNGQALFGFKRNNQGRRVGGIYLRRKTGEDSEGIAVYKDFFIQTEGLTKESVTNKFFPPRAELEFNFAEINKDAALNFKITNDDILEVSDSKQYKSSRTGNIITEDSEERIISERGYKKIDTAAATAANIIIYDTKYSDHKEALYEDAVFGKGGDVITEKTPVGKYLRGFRDDKGNEIGFQGYMPDDFVKIGKNGKIGGDIPLNVRNALAMQHAIDDYKVRFGSGAYYFDEFGHAQESTIPVDKKTTARLDLSDMEVSEGASEFLSQMNIKATDGTLNRSNIMNRRSWFASNDSQREDYIRNLNTIASPESGSRFLDKDQAKKAFYEQYQDAKGNFNQNEISSKEEVDQLWRNKINQFSQKVNNELIEPVLWNIKGNDIRGVDFGYSPTGAFSIALDAAGIKGEKRLQYLSELKKQLANNDYN